MREYVPASSSPTSALHRPASGTLEQLVVPGALGEEEHAPAVGRQLVLADRLRRTIGAAPVRPSSDGHDQRTSRAAV